MIVLINLFFTVNMGTRHGLKEATLGCKVASVKTYFTDTLIQQFV